MILIIVGIVVFWTVVAFVVVFVIRARKEKKAKLITPVVELTDNNKEKKAPALNTTDSHMISVPDLSKMDGDKSYATNGELNDSISKVGVGGV